VTRSHPTRIAAIVVGLIMALLVVLLVFAKTGERDTTTNLIGKPAPGVDGDVIVGDKFDLGASDRWVVVNFFATWCAPCIAEHPQLRAFEQEHRKTGDARVISVVYDDKSSDVERFFDQKGGDWSVFSSDDGRTALDWGVAKIPESYLVSPTGIVVERFVSGVTKAELDAYIDQYQAAADAAAEPGGGS
jgi:cytochrome c biogenesis protein CcmG/thiol:disulfide interchange protein DsbE